jgi:hypothetical protein
VIFLNGTSSSGKTTPGRTLQATDVRRAAELRSWNLTGFMSPALVTASRSRVRGVLRAAQVSARGGELHCEMRGDRVSIAGTAVEYLRGEITVPSDGKG